jgi:hypothetical protein
MDSDQHILAATDVIVRRARARFERHLTATRAGTDRLLAKLLLAQWLFAILLAVTISPYAWEGKVKVVHYHVWIALVLGGLLVSMPVAMGLLRPGRVLTRHVIAVAQMLISALLIHLTGGRIETHFHVFGSLAILAFYLDWKVLLTATVVVVADHLARGLLWPESAYGILNPEWWRFLEHGFWILFMLGFLIASCRRQIREWLAFAEEGGVLEALAEREWRQKSVLERAGMAPAAE